MKNIFTHFFIFILLIFTSCDMQYIEDFVEKEEVVTVPYLVIFNLPYNTQSHHFSDINIYNAAKIVAKCPDYKKIIVLKNNTDPDSPAAAAIPLVYSANNNTFTDTGVFALSFVLDIDFLTQIKIAQNDNLTVDFLIGNAFLDAEPLLPP